MSTLVFERDFREWHLAEAIQRGDLYFVWQPKFDLRSNALIGAEGLVRWSHRTYGILGPASFLPHVTDPAILEELTRYAVRSGVGQWSQWASRGLSIPVSINVSPLILTRAGFVDWVVSLIEEENIPSGALTLEITEETLIADADSAAEAISSLREVGVGISVDDFGAGYSSLSHLLDYAITEIKIDRHFVEAMATDPRARRIVEAMVPLCRELGATMVGEGVSNAGIAHRLTECGCEVGQGYFLARPTTPEGVARIAGSNVGTRTSNRIEGGGEVSIHAAADGIQ